MKSLITLFIVTGVFLLPATAALAQQGDQKKQTDPDPAKKQPEKTDGGSFNIDMLMKLVDQVKGKDGKFDPEALKKMLEKIGVGEGGKFDPEQLKKMVEPIVGKGGPLDPEQLKKMMEPLTAKGGLLDPEQLKKLMDKFAGPDGKFDPEQIKKMIGEILTNAGKADPAQLQKIKDVDKDKGKDKDNQAISSELSAFSQSCHVREIAVGVHTTAQLTKSWEAIMDNNRDWWLYGAIPAES